MHRRLLTATTVPPRAQEPSATQLANKVAEMQSQLIALQERLVTLQTLLLTAKPQTCPACPKSTCKG